MTATIAAQAASPSGPAHGRAPADVGGREIELKFQVPPARRAALERALATATSQRRMLRARYYDTADGRLEAAGLALRLRHDGRHWVQTLKGRGDGVWQRLEHEVVLSPQDGDPPQPDVARHAGTEAGRALDRALASAASRPRVARTTLQLAHASEIVRITRVLRHGGARIEAALDVGVIEAGSHRTEVVEIEFEWLGGPAVGPPGGSPAPMLALAARWADRFGLWLDPTPKSARAAWLARGIERPPATLAGPGLVIPPDATPGAARAAMVGAALAHALPNAAALAAGQGDAAHVHQLRVALRRLRSVLRVLGPDDPARDAALRALFTALGASRDAEVLVATLGPARAAAAAAGWAAPPHSAGPDVVPDATPDPRPAEIAAALASPATTRLWLALLGSTIDPAGSDEPRAATDDASGAAAAGAAAPSGRASPAPPWSLAVVAHVARERRRARRAAKAWGGLDTAGRHRLRRRLKRLRYLLEFSASEWPRKALRRELAALKPLQERLGEWHDLVVAQASEAVAAAPDAPAEAGFVAGWLAQAAAHAERRVQKAGARWLRLRKSMPVRASGRRRTRR